MDDNLILNLDRLVQSITAGICCKYGCWDRLDDLVGEGHLVVAQAASSQARLDSLSSANQVKNLRARSPFHEPWAFIARRSSDGTAAC